MPIVFETKFDGSNGIRYFHISLVRLYLDQAYRHALEAKNTTSDEELSSSITAIVFSAMSLEAFVNEISEDIIEKEELNKFIRLKKPYLMENGEGSVSAKCRILFEKEFNHKLGNNTSESIQALFKKTGSENNIL